MCCVSSGCVLVSVWCVCVCLLLVCVCLPGVYEFLEILKDFRFS